MSSSLTPQKIHHAQRANVRLICGSSNFLSWHGVEVRRRVPAQMSPSSLDHGSKLRNLEGNEIADTLAKAGACEVPEPSAPLTFLEFSLELNTRIRPLGLPPHSTIGINVLVLEALWLTVLQDRIKLF
ncbi:hypothetical protein TNCV_955081 [Trichonephila clavipes]|nr:hypothetical protein TNCV_955081 [Trichonephila clavipes]